KCQISACRFHFLSIQLSIHLAPQLCSKKKRKISPRTQTKPSPAGADGSTQRRRSRRSSLCSSRLTHLVGPLFPHAPLAAGIDESLISPPPPRSADWPLVSSPEMATGSMEAALMSDPTIKVPDDLLVEVISRVPYKSTCCCKCVSTRWRDLISHPDHRDKLPRSTLAGFFHTTSATGDHKYLSHGYLSVSGNWCPHDASLSFLPEYESLQILDGCNGLLLCLRPEVVCPRDTG
uniref:F-box domain-containing protein n=1 Tax=Aegilops tauschii subsp. strangulata TaxID=200361 RepID=A0A453GGH3_AEGTS